MAMIEIKNISKWYGSFQVLKDCSVNVEKGEVVVVCGPSGSGKSTLIKTIVGVLPKLAGDLRRGQGLSIGYFAQHQLDALRMDETPLEHMRRLAPDEREQTLNQLLVEMDGFSANEGVIVIAATNRNLREEVSEGRFREDLFHRLNVIRVHLPPLRERREDIPRLARHFLQVAARELGVEAKLLHPETEAALTRLAWPGNVRQLENTCRWLTVMAAGQEVLIQDLPGELFESTVAESTSQMQPDSWATLLAQWADRALRSGHQNLLSEAQPELERTLLTTALRHTQGHKQEAARLLGWGRNTLTRKLKELGME